MLFLTDYRLKSHITREDSKRLMEVFAKQGSASPGEVAHYVKIDGSGGFVITEGDDITAMYSYLLPFAEFMDFNVTPGLKIEDAVGPILASLED